MSRIRAPSGDEVDQAHLGLVAGLERLRQRAALAGGEVAAERPRGAQRAGVVAQVERDVQTAEVGLAGVGDLTVTK